MCDPSSPPHERGCLGCEYADPEYAPRFSYKALQQERQRRTLLVEVLLVWVYFCLAALVYGEMWAR